MLSAVITKITDRYYPGNKIDQCSRFCSRWSPFTNKIEF